MGKRRTITRGYRRTQVHPERRVSATGEVHTPRRERLWRQVTVRRRSGVVVEKFRGYYAGRPVLREQRFNGRLTYVRVQQRNSSVPAAPAKSWHSLTGEGQVQWQQVQYLVTTPLRL
ncbi:hypothetical protein GCM10027048_08170 [Hymenobacter coalescens]